MLVFYPIPGTYENKEFDVSIIVPLYKSVKVVQDQIRRWIPEDDVSVEIVYVDDHCPQGSYMAVKDAWLRRSDNHKFCVKIVASETNNGFGGACNLGARHAKGKNLIFLNADTTGTPYWIKNMNDALNSDPMVGIVGNLQIKEGGDLHGTIDSAGSEWHWEEQNFLHIGRHIYEGEILDKPFYPEQVNLKTIECEMVTGCCLGIKKSLFDQIGGFDMRYKIAYWEDSELCMVVREMGYKIIFEPSSVIYHKLGHTKVQGESYLVDNKEFFINKWVNTGRIDSLVKAKRLVPMTEISNILVKRTAAHGDVLMAAAVVPALKKKFPGANVYFSTGCPNILLGNPYIDGIMHLVEGDGNTGVKTDEEDENLQNDVDNDLSIQYACDLDMVYERRPFTNILQAYADECGVPVSDCRLTMDLKSVNKELFKNYVVIHAGKTNWIGRNWHQKSFEELALKIHEAGYQVICVGNQNDSFVPCDADARGITTLQELATIIHDAKLFVGIDSLPFHIAQATKTPGVVFFGSIDPKSRIVNDNMTAVTAKNLACLGCHHRKAAPSTWTYECETATLDCENLVKVNDMWNVICKKLQDKE